MKLIPGMPADVFLQTGARTVLSYLIGIPPEGGCLWYASGMFQRKTIALAALALLSVTHVEAATFAVTNVNDSGAGSLRQAILSANAAPGVRHTIPIQIGAGRKTICPLTPLEPITAEVLIDGWTQGGYALRPIVELDGSCAAAGSGLTITGGNSIIRGFVINKWNENGIRISGAGNNVILGNYIGTDRTGKQAAPNAVGVNIIASNDNRIGGTTEAGVNLISGNTGNGINVIDGSTGNSVIHNLIGTDITGQARVANGATGVVILQSMNNTIGGAGAVYRNIISGNVTYGVMVAGDTASGNKLIGNYIGTDKSGVKELANARTGILIFNAPSNTIGGRTPPERNVISGNLRAGINIDGSRFPFDNPAPYSGRGHAKLNRVIGNYIGVDASGTKALPNFLPGVRLFKSQQNRIGGDLPGEGNVISGNTEDGILMQSEDDRSDPRLVARFNHVLGNKIGTDKSGTKQIPNRRHGIFIIGERNHVGGPTKPSGNMIRFNLGVGYVSKGPTYQTNTNSGHNVILSNRQANVVYIP